MMEDKAQAEGINLIVARETYSVMESARRQAVENMISMTLQSRHYAIPMMRFTLMGLETQMQACRMVANMAKAMTKAAGPEEE